MTQQMEAFRRDMAKDGSAQRGEVRRLVQGFSQRAEALVESTLRVCPMHIWGVCGDVGWGLGNLQSKAVQRRSRDPPCGCV